MKLPIEPPLEPMEARQVEAIPEGDAWQYEPKWDGFRCLAFRDGDELYLQSRNGRPLARYFPELAQALLETGSKRFVLDGELVVPVERRLSFEQLQLRLHPAASRVRKLAAEHPAVLIAFDLLVTERRTDLTSRPLSERRQRLEKFAARYFDGHQSVRLSPASRQRSAADDWFRRTGGALDGVIAKQLDARYLPGSREAVVKVKNLRSADCVVAGFRYSTTRSDQAASLLLGLYDEEGKLNHVGYTSSLGVEDFETLTPRLEGLSRRKRSPRGFTGRAPDGPSRWSREGSREYVKLPHELVVEVRYDHVSGERFRHGTKFLRWRPDKDPAQCTLSQIETGAGALLLFGQGRLSALRRRSAPRQSIRRARASPQRSRAARRRP
ncbi:MAG: ATP-dependent DNA ligase [Planctomycetes bacterium]|nr:ATP-dependent DNA ligase [Planctomycetota bacterium]